MASSVAVASAALRSHKYKLVFFVPTANVAACKTAVFAAGAGRYEPNYSECCFTTLGTGQFRPADTANPHIGKAGGQVEEVQEARVETVVTGGEDVMRGVVEALKKAHPYEEPAYEVYKLENF